MQGTLKRFRVVYIGEAQPSVAKKTPVSPGGLAVKHPALGANGHRFEPSKRSKLFQRLISRLTISWVTGHIKWRCRLHWII